MRPTSSSLPSCVLLAALLFSLSVAVPPAQAGKLNARDLMQKSEDLHRLPAQREVAVMVLQSSGGSERTLQYEAHVVQDKKTGDKVRIEFSEPADVRGTALLTVENVSARDDDQWLYLPAFRKTRRVGKADLGDRFVGSDVYFEDMKRRYVDDYDYTFIGTGNVDGADCYIIESRPKAGKVKRESPYGKNRLWLRKDNLFVVKARHFDRRLAPLKEVHVTKLVRVRGKAWRANRVEIVDVKRKHRTVILVKKRQSLAAMPAGSFSKHRLGAK